MQRFQPLLVSRFVQKFTPKVTTNHLSTSFKTVRGNVFQTQHRSLTSNVRPTTISAAIIPTHTKSNYLKYAYAALAALFALCTLSPSFKSYADVDPQFSSQNELDILKKANCSPEDMTRFLLQQLALYHVYGVCGMILRSAFVNDLCGFDAVLSHMDVSDVSANAFLSRKPVEIFDREMEKEAEEGRVNVGLRFDFVSATLRRLLSLRNYMEIDNDVVKKISSNTEFNANLRKTLDELETLTSAIGTMNDDEVNKAMVDIFSTLARYTDYVRLRYALIYIGELDDNANFKSTPTKSIIFDSTSSPPKHLVGYERLQMYYDANSHEFVNNFADFKRQEMEK